MPFDPNQAYEVEPAKKSGFNPAAAYEAAPTASSEKRAQLAKQAENIRKMDMPDWAKNKVLKDIEEQDRRAQLPEAPKWDLLGDTGRAAKDSATALVEDAKAAFPSAETQAAEFAANKEKYGPALGFAKSAIVDPVNGFGNALRMPLDALGVLASPLTGALHSGPGSLLSYLPGMDKRMADEGVDTAMMGMGPGAMRTGSLAATQRVAAAERSTAARTARVNALAANAEAASKDPLLVQARQAGYVIHPAEASAKPGFVADTASGFGGKIKTQQEASARNQEVNKRLAAADLGLPSDAVLDEATFSAVRKNESRTYQNVEKAASEVPGGVIKADEDFLKRVNNLDNAGDDLRRDFPELGEHPDIGKLQLSIAKSEFSPRAGVEAIKRLRFQSKENFKALGDPSKRQLAQAQRDAANALEDLIDRRLTEAGHDTAVQEYRAARQVIAKSYDIEAATDAAGNVDARKLAKMASKRPFTGNLKIIADTADRFPKSMQAPKFGGVEKRSILDTMTTLLSVGGAVGIDPWLALGAAAPLARPAARSIALSEKLQNRLAGLRTPDQFGPGVRQSVGPAIAGANYLRSLPAPTGAPVAQPQPQNGQ